MQQDINFSRGTQQMTSKRNHAFNDQSNGQQTPRCSYSYPALSCNQTPRQSKNKIAESAYTQERQQMVVDLRLCSQYSPRSTLGDNWTKSYFKNVFNLINSINKVHFFIFFGLCFCTFVIFLLAFQFSSVLLRSAFGYLEPTLGMARP